MPRKRLQRLPRGEAGSMGQSGRVRPGGSGGHGALVGSRPKPGRSPPACRPRSPDIRSALVPRRSSVTLRRTPRSRTHSCSREAERVAVSSSSAWMCDGSWNLSPPPACRSASLSPSAPVSGLGILARTLGQKLMVKFSSRAPAFHVGGPCLIPAPLDPVVINGVQAKSGIGRRGR